MKSITLFSDGSSLGNPGFGGYCAILRYKSSEKIISGGEVDTTNNRMELKAVIEGLKVLKEPCEVEIISDSIYVTKGISLWLEGWILKDFNKVKNPDLWREYVEAAKKHVIKTTWVKGHNGHTENEKCDKIAKQEAEKTRKNKGAT
ncbi:MAG: ribonuclease HI [Campylobacteraceae bacterium]|jgi:ribonuclease HI|nr:ribonuclease HI [Campylobacteraceae bacterium]